MVWLGFPCTPRKMGWVLKSGQVQCLDNFRGLGHSSHCHFPWRGYWIRVIVGVCLMLYVLCCFRMRGPKRYLLASVHYPFPPSRSRSTLMTFTHSRWWQTFLITEADLYRAPALAPTVLPAIITADTVVDGAAGRSSGCLPPPSIIKTSVSSCSTHYVYTLTPRAHSRGTRYVCARIGGAWE